MSLSSSLNASVSGLNVNASKLATISDNISNAGTNGYKRVDTEFSSMIVNDSTTKYTAGGVRGSVVRDVSARGALESSDNPLDLAVTQRGFLPVTTSSAVDAGETDLPLRFTTTGSFRPDEDGYLRTSSGLVLLGWPADGNGDIIEGSRSSMTGIEPVRILTSAFAAAPTDEIVLGVNLPAEATDNATSSFTPYSAPIEYYDNLGVARTLTAEFTPVDPGVGNPPSNSWDVVLSDSASGGATVATYTVLFDDTRGNGGNIDTVSAVTVVGAGTGYDSTTGLLSTEVAGGLMTIDIGAEGSSDRMTQLAAEFAPTGITRNGAEISNITGVEVDESGMVQAIYESGFVKTIYQIPLADMANPDGLTAESAQSFSISAASGPYYFWDAGAGPTGSVVGSALEQSTTDIAAELTQLIETQRAYSSNAKVVQTVDEMLQETTNIKR